MKDPFTQAYRWRKQDATHATGEPRPWHRPVTQSEIDLYQRLVKKLAALHAAVGTGEARVPGAKTSRSWHKDVPPTDK